MAFETDLTSKHMLQGNKDKGKERLGALTATTDDFQPLNRSDFQTPLKKKKKKNDKR